MSTQTKQDIDDDVIMLTQSFGNLGRDSEPQGGSQQAQEQGEQSQGGTTSFVRGQRQEDADEKSVVTKNRPTVSKFNSSLNSARGKPDH